MENNARSKVSLSNAAYGDALEPRTASKDLVLAIWRYKFILSTDVLRVAMVGIVV